MSWWKYKGDAKNLFAGNASSNGRETTSIPTELLNCVDGWTQELEKAKTYSQVYDICKVNQLPLQLSMSRYPTACFLGYFSSVGQGENAEFLRYR
jgi:hypothetical protein